MYKLKSNNKGVVLLFVIATLLVVVCLAVAALSQVLSHSRLTLHLVSRTKAYYANLAGLNLAREYLRLGTWNPATQTNYTLCSSAACTVQDPDIPYTVTITVYPNGTSIAGSGVIPGRKITASTTYTSTYTY